MHRWLELFQYQYTSQPEAGLRNGEEETFQDSTILTARQESWDRTL